MIAGRTITNMRFADDIDLMARTKKELKYITNQLDATARWNGMAVNSKKSQIVTTRGPD